MLLGSGLEAISLLPYPDHLSIQFILIQKQSICDDMGIGAQNELRGHQTFAQKISWSLVFLCLKKNYHIKKLESNLFAMRLAE